MRGAMLFPFRRDGLVLGCSASGSRGEKRAKIRDAPYFVGVVLAEVPSLKGGPNSFQNLVVVLLTGPCSLFARSFEQAPAKRA